MKKRAAETLMEVVIAMTLFGIIMTGMLEFMANQTQAMSIRETRKILMNSVQKYVHAGSWVDSEDKVLGVMFTYDPNNNGGCISVVENKTSGDVLMEIYIDPPRE